MRIKKYFITLCCILTISNCKKDDRQDTNFNLFPISYDKSIGLNMRSQLTSSSSDIKVVPRSGNEKAYEHIDRIKRTILGTGKVAYDKEFAWEVFIVKNDKVLNAFATPGGYLYFYTGLINFCSNEAELAGVMAHEVAHAANRHSSSQMTKVLGLQVVKAIVFGNDTSSLKSYTADLAIGASALKFSRDDEYAADKHAVDYLYNTEYHAPELAQFFVKMQNQSRVKPPEFLSTHPSDDNRIKKINEEWKNKGGKSGQLFESRYAEFKALLK